MKINFIISDDQEIALNNTRNYVEKFIKNNDMNGRIVLCTKNPHDVLKYSKDHNDETNVYILDINFNNDINGLGLVRNIRQREPNAYIIYITAHAQLSMMTFKYKLKVFDFLVKPISYSDIEESIKALQQELTQVEQVEKSNSKNFITVTSGYQEHQIYADEIIYIESFGPKITLNLTDGKVETYVTLKEIQAELNKTQDTFYRIHKSYIVNINHVKEYNLNKMEVIMDTGEICPVSRTQKNVFKEVVK
jgi:two-component system, LytTR family, response regulator AgrA